MAKKETKNKKVASKNAKSTKVSKVTEKQIEVIKETPVEAKNDNFDFDKYKDEKGEYDLRNASEKEIIEAFKNMSPEDKIFVTKEESIAEDTADVVVEDAIANTIEEIIEAPVKVAEKAVEEVNKITKKVDRTFGYLWNGQAIDF